MSVGAAQAAGGGRLLRPHEVAIPGDCAGWEALYPYHAVFGADRREADAERFWFHDGLHFPEPLYPFDEVVAGCLFVGLGQANARLFAMPPALGGEYRVLNGYVYSSPNAVADPATVQRRSEVFRVRAGHYYANWDELYARWRTKVEAEIRALEDLEVPALPELEAEAVVTGARGWGASHALLVAYDGLLHGLDRVVQYHFEFLNLGYAAYVGLYELCRDVFPGMADATIGRLVAGVDLLVLRPDDELRRLARLAVEAGVGDAVRHAGSEAQLRAVLGAGEAGARWLAALDDAKRPWFCFSYGNGLAHHHRSWIDDTTLPLAAIGAYVERLEAGEDIARPSESVAAERERITAAHRARLPEARREEFDERLALARRVFPYVEDHSFFVEHWYLTRFWNKVREFGALLAGHGFLADPDDVFCLRHDEVRAALEELRAWWAAGGVGVARGPLHWPPIVARRRALLHAMRRWRAPPALGTAAAVDDPLTVMLWGVTGERMAEWIVSAGATGAPVLSGIGCSPGVAEGPARVILVPEQLGEIEDGDVLIAPSTSTSWTPVFAKLAAAVLDIGGIMSHAAIVAREYGLPAVVATGNATQTIRTGDRVRVDGGTGAVTVVG